MSADDRGAVCLSEPNDRCSDEKRKKPTRKVCFPEDDQLVTQYFEPANPWQNVPPTTRSQLAAEYLECCRRHCTEPLDCVLQQIRDLPEACIGGASRAVRLTLCDVALRGAAPADALEALLRRVQFRRVELQAALDDEAAEALFDMVEYYESTTAIALSGPRLFGIRGWQAASRMIKKQSQSLCVLNVGRNAVGADAVRALSRGGALLSLGLQCARLGPDCARALHDLVRAETRLQRLDLRDNKLGGAGLQAILAALKENSTLTQIDLDEPHESTTLTAEDSEAATVARLTREIQALCRKNEPEVSPERRTHRKISLTCHSAAHIAPRQAPTLEEERRGRLRSPLPSPAASPAGSPVPAGAAPAPSRFSVTRVAADRQPASAPATPTRTTHSPSSRFKVVQVAEPPTIHIHTPEPSRKSTRFSVTRNYDVSYNITPVPSPPPTPISGTFHGAGTAFYADSTVGTTPPRFSECGSGNDVEGNRTVRSEVMETGPGDMCSNKGDNCDDKNNVKTGEQVDIKASNVDSNILKSNVNTGDEANVHKSLVNIVETVDKDRGVVKSCLNSKSDTQISDSDGECRVKTEALPSNTAVDRLGNNDVLRTETELVSGPTDRRAENLDVKVEATVRTETDVENTEDASAIVHNNQNVEFIKDVGSNANAESLSRDSIAMEIETSNPSEKRNEIAMKQIESITEDLGHLIQEMKDMSTKTAVLTKKDVRVKSDCTQTENVIITSQVDFDERARLNAKLIRTHDNVVLKKNKSESSLDSPDLEVSRLMNKKVSGSPFCDSSSSLEISGSSMESLNALDQIHVSYPNTQRSSSSKGIQIVPRPIEIQKSIESDTELDRRKTTGQITLSTECSVESNTSEGTVNTGNFLNMSVSSNESVSPIIFSAKKIHGSLSSLEASVSSLDSVRQERTMVTSADSGIEYSIHHPAEKEDDSSNEGTLTNNSNLREGVKKVDSFLRDTLTSSPKRTSSLLDVPALKNKGLDRMRKISWVAPSSSFHIPKPEPEKETKLPSHLEKLLSLFQHPTSLFARSSQSEEEKKCNTPPRKDSSLTSSFWSWGSSSEKEKETVEVTSVVTEESSVSSQVRQSKSTVEILQIGSNPMQSSRPDFTGNSEASSFTSEVTLLSSTQAQSNVASGHSNRKVAGSNADVAHLTKDSKASSESTQVTFSLETDDSSSSDSTLSERAQIAFIDESFSKKLDSKTSSTDTENTLSEYQSAQISSDSVSQDKSDDSTQNHPRPEIPKDDSSTQDCTKCHELEKVTDNNKTTDLTTDICNAVQSLVLSESCDSSNGNRPVDKDVPRASDITDLTQPNDMNRNYDTTDKDSCEWKYSAGVPETVPCLENTGITDSVIKEDTAQKDVLFEKSLIATCDEKMEMDWATACTSLDKHEVSSLSPVYYVAETISTKNLAQENKEYLTVLLTDEKSESDKSEELKEPLRPRSFAAVLRASGSENTIEKSSCVDGQPVDKLPSKVIQGIKENISPENTLTSSMTNTKTLAIELKKQAKNQPIVNTVWEISVPTLHKDGNLDSDRDGKESCSEKAACCRNTNLEGDVESCLQKEKQCIAPIATIDEASEDIPQPGSSVKLQLLDDITFIDEKTTEERVASSETMTEGNQDEAIALESNETESVDLAKDALSYLIYENQDFDPETEATVSTVKMPESSLAQELQDAENKEKHIDLSPELVIESAETPELFTDFRALHASPLVPDRAKLKKSNSLETLVIEEDNTSPKTKTIAFKIPETSPRDIPRKPKLRTRSGSSPKSLPETLSKSCPVTKLDSTKRKKKVTSLGKIAKDSLLALNMTEEEIAEFRRSHKLTSVESLRSLESVSEDANSQSGTSYDSRCRACLRTSQESLMSLDSITEDCRCSEVSDRGEKLSRSAR